MEVVPGVHAIGAVGAKVLLFEEDRLTLVDAGGPGSAGRVLAYIAGLGRRPSEVDRIVLTHAHFDHTGSLAELQRATGASVCVHESEADWVAGQAEPPPLVTNPLVDSVLRPVVRTEPVAVDRRLRDGDWLPFMGGAWVVHVPGHTRGSIALHIPSRRMLVVGDALQVRWGRLALPSKVFTEDMARARRSIQRLAELDVDVLVFSHFGARRGAVQTELAALAGRWAEKVSA
jgi:glyoxylase-like metal-dependent hydrolase (beta-lactamase superfamily II)